MICPPPYSGHQIKQNEMGGACGTYWKDEMGVQCFDCSTLREGNHWEDQAYVEQ